MKKGIQTKHNIHAPINAVWDLIKTGAKWEDWLSILADSNVDGNTRTCGVPTPDGGKDVFEEIFLATDLEKTFVYQIQKQQSFPASDIIGYIQLEEQGDNTKMFWSVEMDVESDEIFNELKEKIEHIYAEGASNLEKLATVAV